MLKKGSVPHSKKRNTGVTLEQPPIQESDPLLFVT